MSKKLKTALAATAAAAALVVSTAVPASAYQADWRSAGYWGSWGPSCPPVVEYHGNGWETVREVRRERWWPGHSTGPCSRTGYVQTGYTTRLFPMYY